MRSDDSQHLSRHDDFRIMDADTWDCRAAIAKERPWVSLPRFRMIDGVLDEKDLNIALGMDPPPCIEVARWRFLLLKWGVDLQVSCV